MTKPLISIIIPAYNLETLLSKTLDSVLAQSYSNLEIIVVNDGSTDCTGDIINSYSVKDNRIKAIHKENGGVTSARLLGVREATGDWIGFVDGDDYIEPEMYEKLLHNAIAYKADISHCGYQMVFPYRVDYYYNTGCIVKQDRLSGLKDLIQGSYIEPGLWNKLFHKNLFHSLLHGDTIDTSIKINEDFLMNYWLFKASDFAVYEDFCPYHYIVRKNSAANSKINKHKLWDPLRVTQIILGDVPEAVKPVAFERLIRQLINGATMSSTQDPELIKPFRTYARKELRAKQKAVLCGKFSTKLKIMSLWASLWPTSYGFVHTLYAKITGLDKIYDIE